MVGGPLSHGTHKRNVGVRARTKRFAGAATPTYRNPNPILKRAASDGMCSPPPLPSSAGSPPAPLDFSPPRWTTPTTPRHWRPRCCAARRNVKELTQSYGYRGTHTSILTFSTCKCVYRSTHTFFLHFSYASVHILNFRPRATWKGE